MKADDAELARQVEQALEAVVEWMTKGHTEADIREALAAQFPAAPPLIVLTKLGERLDKEGRPDRFAVRGWALLALRELYRRMVEIGDFAGAMKAVKEIANLADRAE